MDGFEGGGGWRMDGFEGEKGVANGRGKPNLITQTCGNKRFTFSRSRRFEKWRGGKKPRGRPTEAVRGEP